MSTCNLLIIKTTPPYVCQKISVKLQVPSGTKNRSLYQIYVLVQPHKCPDFPIFLYNFGVTQEVSGWKFILTECILDGIYTRTIKIISWYLTFKLIIKKFTFDRQNFTTSQLHLLWRRRTAVAASCSDTWGDSTQTVLFLGG